MLVILLDVEDNRARQLHLREQVEISQDEEDLALGLEVGDHELLVGEEVVLFRVPLVHISVHVSSRVHNLILAVLTIPQREDVVATLDHEEGEVEIGQLEVNVANLADRLLRGGPRALIHLLTSASLKNGHLELAIGASIVIVAAFAELHLKLNV